MRCARCKRELPQSAFYGAQKYVCKECMKAYQREWHGGNGRKEPSGECCGTCRSFSKGATGGWCMKRCKGTRSGNVCPAYRATVVREGRYEEEVKTISVYSKNWE